MYGVPERPGTLHLRGRGEYVNTKVRTSERVLSDQAEPRDYNPVHSDIWNLHKSSYQRMSDLTHGQFHTTTRDDFDRVIREKARLPSNKAHALHTIRSFHVTDTALSRHLARLETGALPQHPIDHNQHRMKTTYRDSYGQDSRQGQPREPRCWPQQPADKWMAFRKRKTWLFDTERAPHQFVDDSLNCPPIPKDERACREADPPLDPPSHSIDELEAQVAATDERARRRYPAEPSTEPVPEDQTQPEQQGEDLLRPDGDTVPRVCSQPPQPLPPLQPPPAVHELNADIQRMKEPCTPRQRGEGEADATEPGDRVAVVEPVVVWESAEPGQAIVGQPEPPRDRSGEVQHREPSYSDLKCPDRQPQRLPCPETPELMQPPPYGLHPSLPVTKDLQQAGPPDPGSAARGPHPDDADAGRGQYQRICDPEYPSAFRLARPCTGREKDTSAIFPCPQTRECPPPCPPPPPPPCPRGPVPCETTPTAIPIPRERMPPSRYRSTYTAGYADPDAGLRALAAPRSMRELYQSPPVPKLLPGMLRCREGLSLGAEGDVEPCPGPRTPAACEATVGEGEGLTGSRTPGRPGVPL